MNRSALFALGLVIALACAVLAVVYWVGGTPLGHHIKHGILFIGIAIVAFLFAMANRPMSVTQ